MSRDRRGGSMSGAVIRSTWGRRIAKLVLPAILASAAIGLWGLQRERSRTLTVPVLMYHKIGPEADSVWWVSPRDFEAQLKFLREAGYRSVLPADLAANRRWGNPLPRRPVVLTFDDGYLNNLTEAEPLLRKYGFRGIVYLTTARIAEEPGQRVTAEGAEYLTWGEVKEMSARGTLAFGAHGHTHANLAAARDPWPDVRECYRQIKHHLKARPDSFCYPGGQVSDAVEAAVRRSGFTTAMVCEDRVARLELGAGLFRIARISVFGGRRVFRVSAPSSAVADGRLALTHEVSIAGVPVPISPCIRWEGGAGGGRAVAWLPESEPGEQPAAFRWAVPSSAAGRPYRVELWDRNRVLRLHASQRFTVPAASPAAPAKALLPPDAVR